MSDMKSGRSISYRDMLYRALIFVCSVAVITYFLPRDSKFNYQFDIDKPWKYGQLIATFDFPIYKSEEVVKREQDSLFSRFQPYYSLNEQVVKEVVAQLRSDYSQRLRAILPSADYLRHIERRLAEVYRAGILPTETLARLRADSIAAIRIIHDKTAVQRPLAQLYSVKEAYHYLLYADSLHYRPHVLKQCALNEYLYPNLTYDEQRTATARDELLGSYSWANGLVLSGQKIIDRGEIVTPQTYNILESLRRESIQRSETFGQKRLIWGGQLLYVSLFVLCFMLYLDIFRPHYFRRRRSLLLLFALIIAFSVVTSVMVSNHLLHVFILPYAMLPVILRVFLDSRTAFMAHVMTILICSICLRYPHEFILLQTLAGMVAIFSLRELSQRSQLIHTAALVIVVYALLPRGALQHQHPPAAPHVGDGSRHLPALHADGQPGGRGGQPHRGQQPAGAYRCPLPRHRQDGESRLLHRKPVGSQSAQEPQL